MNWREERDREYAEKAERRKREREARMAEEARKMAEHQAELFAGRDLPRELLERTYAYAWQEGHAYGFESVTGVFEDLVGFVEAAYKAGQAAR